MSLIVYASSPSAPRVSFLVLPVIASTTAVALPLYPHTIVENLNPACVSLAQIVHSFPTWPARISDLRPLDSHLTSLVTTRQHAWVRSTTKRAGEVEMR